MSEKKGENVDEELPSNRIAPKLYDEVKSQETRLGKKVDLKHTLVNFFDDVLADRTDVTPEQQGKLARLRAKIEIELKDF